MACSTSTPPYCKAYADGRECTDATTCMIVDSVGAEAPVAGAEMIIALLQCTM